MVISIICIPTCRCLVW